MEFTTSPYAICHGNPQEIPMKSPAFHELEGRHRPARRHRVERDGPSAGDGPRESRAAARGRAPRPETVEGAIEGGAPVPVHAFSW